MCPTQREEQLTPCSLRVSGTLMEGVDLEAPSPPPPAPARRRGRAGTSQAELQSRAGICKVANWGWF